MAGPEPVGGRHPEPVHRAGLEVCGQGCLLARVAGGEPSVLPWLADTHEVSINTTVTTARLHYMQCMSTQVATDLCQYLIGSSDKNIFKSTSNTRTIIFMCIVECHR